MKILLVFTGGTIGSVVQEDTINTSANAGFKLIELFKHQQPDAQVEFDCIAPLQILSENLHPSLWTVLIKAIEAQDLNQYAGIIVTHGTDTLAFTAAALSFYFRSLHKPLLLVSSNYPLEHRLANGVTNFICAVEFIRQRLQNGVFVPYTNPGEATHVHLGSRLAASLQLSGDFISVQNRYYLEFVDRQFRYVDAKLAPPKANFSLKTEFDRRILLIKPYPGLDYTAFNLNGCAAVLHDLYHSGTACSSLDYGLQHSSLSFIKTCRQMQLPVYLAPALKTEAAYAGTRELQHEGGQMLWNMSLEAAYTKLLFAYNSFDTETEISAFLAEDIALEHVEI